MCIRDRIDYDAISKTYKTGDKQYTTVYGAYVGTYKHEDGDTELVDNTLVKPEEADTPVSYTHLDVYKRQVL